MAALALSFMWPGHVSALHMHRGRTVAYLDLLEQRGRARSYNFGGAHRARNATWSANKAGRPSLIVGPRRLASGGQMGIRPIRLGCTGRHRCWYFVAVFRLIVDVRWHEHGRATPMTTATNKHCTPSTTIRAIATPTNWTRQNQDLCRLTRLPSGSFLPAPKARQ